MLRIISPSLSVSSLWTNQIVRRSSAQSIRDSIPVKSDRKYVPEAISDEPYTLYTNPRKWRSIGLTMLAGSQTVFWGCATSLSTQASEPLLGTAWTVGGLGLSALFAFMVSAYLRRLVAHIHLLNGPIIRVTPHGIAGTLGGPVDLPARYIIPGSTCNNTKASYWNFGARQDNGRTIYYVVDMREGVKDLSGLVAIVRGDKHVIAWSLKRDAELMKRRWQEWCNKPSD